MLEKYLTCRNCGLSVDLGKNYYCNKCFNILDVSYNYKSLVDEGIVETIFKGSPNNIWHYFEILPLLNKVNIVSMGEGNTPLVKSKKISSMYNIKSLYFKLESQNPTASFKDRPISVGISKAVEFGASVVIVASAGNAAASAAAYAARAGLKCIVCVPKDTPPSKVYQALSYGANLVLVNGGYERSYSIAKEASEKYGFYNLTTTFLNPYTVEGNKTVAYEIWNQLNHKVPDSVIIPTGAGPLLVGCYKGFLELRTFGLIDKLPKMIGVQAEACSPLVRAFSLRENEVQEWHSSFNSILSGITDPLIGYPQDGTLTKEIIMKSNGTAISITDNEALTACNLLATSEGVFCEPTAAASVGGLLKAFDKKITSQEIIVAVITGHGLKTPKALIEKNYSSPIVSNVEELIKIL